MFSYGTCGSYKKRPQFCKDYPQVHDFIPPGCTFHFVGEERRGECQPKVCKEHCCCGYPREGGEPEGLSLDALAGGLPCKHLVWIEEPTTKSADIRENVSSTNSEMAKAISETLSEIE